jgi:CRISPR-associated protein Cas1
METLYLISGSKISRRDNTVCITPKDGKARLFPVESLKHIVVAGSAQFNSELLAFLGKRGVRLSFLDYYGNFSGSLEGANPHTAGAVHLAQATIILDTGKRLILAKHILSAALHNLLANLRYYSYRGNALLQPTVTAIQKHMHTLQEAHSVEQMMGCEGLARQGYYAAWQHINPALAIERRTRRPPTDRINALISYCNGLVYSLCKNELAKTHLDGTLSFIHAPTQARASLALDLAEIFKPILADKIIFGLVNRHMLGDSDFAEADNLCRFTETGRRKVVESFREKVDLEQLDDVRGYRTIVLREAFHLQAHVLGMTPYKAYKQKA